MVWAKISDTFYDDPTMLALPRDDRLFFVEATTWCCKHETDGVFPLAGVGRFSDTPDPQQTLARLVEAGLVRVAVDADPAVFELVDFLEDQRSRDAITKDRARRAADQRRSRAHRAGDHSLCSKSRVCPDGQLDWNGKPLSPGDSDGDSPRPDQTRPDPQGGTKSKGAGALPPQGSAAAARKPRDVRIDDVVEVLEGRIYSEAATPRMAVFRALGEVPPDDEQVIVAVAIIADSANHREAAERIVVGMDRWGTPDTEEDTAA